MRQTSRPCTAWSDIKINDIYNRALANFGQHLDNLLNNIEIPQEYYNVKNEKNRCIFIQSDSEYVRSVQIESNKDFSLKQPGQFFYTVSSLGDYYNTPDEENKLIQSNNTQIEWLIDVRSKSTNETKRYTFNQNVPIIIR